MHYSLYLFQSSHTLFASIKLDNFTGFLGGVGIGQQDLHRFAETVVKRVEKPFADDLG